jgi:dTDP-4-dehydrorhamnose 3,5-epimerase
MSNFFLQKGLIKNSFKIISKKSQDHRGLFEKIFSFSFLKKKKIIQNTDHIEINYVSSKKKGTLRGFHFQKKPFNETKIIYCVKGKIFDVIVDLRKNSKTYLKKQTLILEPLKFGLVIPKGCAHAYQTMENNSEVLYLSDNKYNKSSEIVLNPTQKNFEIKWPIKKKIISKKDENGKYLSAQLK